MVVLLLLWCERQFSSLSVMCVSVSRSRSLVCVCDCFACTSSVGGSVGLMSMATGHACVCECSLLLNRSEDKEPGRVTDYNTYTLCASETTVWHWTETTLCSVLSGTMDGMTSRLCV